MSVLSCLTSSLAQRFGQPSGLLSVICMCTMADLVCQPGRQDTGMRSVSLTGIHTANFLPVLTAR